MFFGTWLDNCPALDKDSRVTSPSDSVLRALTDDGSFRVIAARTTDTVNGAVQTQKTSGNVAACFGDLITATILLRETMAPQLRVQGIVRGKDASGTMVADSNPGGTARGLIQLAKGKPEIRVAGGFLQMMRTLHDGRIHQGIVEIPTDAGVSAGMMRYMQVSEQIVSVVSIGTLVHGDRILESGGYIVQLLPEAQEGMLAVMTERLADFPAIETLLQSPEFTPAHLIEEILYRMPYALTEQSALRFECNCSLVRVIAGLATLKADEIRSLVEEGGVLDISCDFCGKGYEVSPEQLRGLLKAN